MLAPPMPCTQSTSGTFLKPHQLYINTKIFTSSMFKILELPMRNRLFLFSIKWTRHCFHFNYSLSLRNLGFLETSKLILYSSTRKKKCLKYKFLVSLLFLGCVCVWMMEMEAHNYKESLSYYGVLGVRMDLSVEEISFCLSQACYGNY